MQAIRRTCICLFQISPVSAVLDCSCFRKMHLLRTNGGPNGFSLVFLPCGLLRKCWLAEALSTALWPSICLENAQRHQLSWHQNCVGSRSYVSVNLSREQWNSWNILTLKCSVKRTRENFRFLCLNFSPRGDWGLIIQQENSMHTPASLSVLVSGRVV